MRRERTKQTFNLQLLALVLALALIWYSLNPAPRPVIRKKREAEPPDEKKRNVAPQSMPATFLITFRPTGGAAELLPSPDEDKDDLDWPEFIDG
ncbi:MAG: hypothetical protein DMF64_17960 [Acidobacteria bacterium]|nr:MAG: hypothetical protein DMF64_17960 [Acidobacteriota bacterium]